MKTEEKKARIKDLAVELLTYSCEVMISQQIDRALNSGAIDIDAWDEKNSPMILPKCIVTAILQNESHQYEGKGSSFENRIKKEVKNIQYFL